MSRVSAHQIQRQDLERAWLGSTVAKTGPDRLPTQNSRQTIRSTSWKKPRAFLELASHQRLCIKQS